MTIDVELFSEIEDITGVGHKTKSSFPGNSGMTNYFGTKYNVDVISFW